ncbi:MAG: hypothetical protein JNN11_01515 [Candidatus Doudnabacteria bacterium]|nr:hypothetical protein [Candidatus Doudnabacteria bacterium]
MDLNEKINVFFSELGLTGTDEEILNAKEMFKDRLFKVVMETFVGALPSEKKHEFLKVLETSSNPYEEAEKLAAYETGLLSLINESVEKEMEIIRVIFQNKS